ncbi:pectate lyase [Acidovorax sp. NCPPB 3859]|nr:MULTISPECIES: pectate lyase [unclassified Acidovorax]MDA8451310.1 pectate lyase [Acidovorax sp. GBBC 3297]MDA8460755.1 pectate lyase [Acidovorax sp. GBBC 3333]MDA8465790.1 pectate lyase [Acidovorax sp. GBBC 3332]MDA8470722.1 pectate lyase [Acidovorax sp. GBBC 3299]WCM79220.1 pectate lyase [Acidovorax sp. GBBC 712]
MSVSLQTYSQSTSLRTTETPPAMPAGSAELAIDQLVLQVLEQVLKALQGTGQGGHGVGCTGGTRSAEGQRNGPEGVLQRFAELLKHLGQALEKSLAAVRANAFANRLARALGTDTRTLDRLDDGADNGSFQSFAKDFLKNLDALSGNGAASGSGRVGSGSGDDDDDLGDLVRQLILAMLLGNPQALAKLLGHRGAGSDVLLKVLEQFVQLLGLGLQAAGGGAAGGSHAAGGGGAEAMAELVKRLLGAFMQGDTSGVDKLLQGQGGRHSLQEILALLTQLITMLSGGKPDGGGPAGQGGGPGGGPGAGAPACGGGAGPGHAGAGTGTGAGTGAGSKGVDGAHGLAAPSGQGGAPVVRSTDPSRPLSSAQARQLQEAFKPDAVGADGVGIYNTTRVIPAGVQVDFNGARIKAGPALGDGGQAEGQKPLIRMESGSSIANLELSGADGIHAMGDAKLDRIKWADVGEDAFTMKGPGHVEVTNSSAFNASDKIFQLNAGGSFKLDNFTADTFGKAVRTNGGKDFPIDISVTRSSFRNGKEAVVRSDAAQAKIHLAGNTVVDTPHDVIAPQAAQVEGAQHRGTKSYTG